MRRLLHMFALIALLLQCSPLRTCLVEAAVFGANCHAAEPAVATGDAHADRDGACLASDPAHDPACICERPNVPVERAKAAAPAASDAPPVHAARPFERADIRFGPATLAAAIAPAPPSAARRLPLLI